MWTQAHFATLDLEVIRSPVSWAGPDPAPVWLDLAREYTERWHHQQQMRDAVGALEFVSRRMFAPVLSTHVFAMPWTYRSGVADEGPTVTVQITVGLAESGPSNAKGTPGGSTPEHRNTPQRGSRSIGASPGGCIRRASQARRRSDMRASKATITSARSRCGWSP